MKYWLTLFISLVVTISYSQRLDSIRSSLERVYDQSLIYRRSASELINQYGINSKQLDSLNKLILKLDSTALHFVSPIIENQGWLGKSLVGVKANKSLFFIVQHAELSTLKKFLPRLEESVAKRESDPADMALMVDRMLVMQGQPQKFGTQYKYDSVSKKYEFFPIGDLKHIDKRRNSVGLESLRKYSRARGIVLPEN